MSPLKTKERFDRETASHTMKVISDDGVSRHLSFTDNGSNIYRFDLITWPGHLCITGDCGTYVFSRLRDMFEFFRGESINPGYWEEKCISEDLNGRIKKYNPDLFKRAVISDFRGISSEMPYDQRLKLWEEVKSDVLSAADDGPDLAMTAAMNLADEDNMRVFQDFWEHDLTEYTYRFIWNLYAIIHGIAVYDASQSKAA